MSCCNKGPRGRPGFPGNSGVGIAYLALPEADEKTVTFMPQLLEVSQEGLLEYTYLYFNPTPPPPPSNGVNIIEVQRRIYIPDNNLPDGYTIILKDVQGLRAGLNSKIRLLIDVGPNQGISDGSNSGSTQAILSRDSEDNPPFVWLQRTTVNSVPTWVAIAWKSHFSSAV